MAVAPDAQFPAGIQAALKGFETAGDNLKTHSTSDVYRYWRGGGSLFVKVQRPSWSPPLSRERDAMAWLAGKIPVPEVVAYAEEEDVEYLVTRGLPGVSAENESCHGDKQALVERLAAALQEIHALDTTGCPLDSRPEALIASGRERIREGIVTREMVEEEGMAGKPDDALDELASVVPEPDTIVFTHGDYCLPNVMIDTGRVVGFIDLGYAGVGDPYRDFIAADYSVRRNLGDAWVAPFFAAYGIDPDPDRLRWHRKIQAFC